MAVESELMNKAKEEGISMPGQEETKQDTPVVAKETATTPVTTEETPASGEQTPKVETPIAPVEPKQRFEDNPGFKNVLRQRDSFKSELQKAQESNAKLMALLEKQSQPSPQASPLSEQESAKKQLREILGIDGLTETIESLKKTNSEYSERERNQAFDREQEGIVKSCQKFGQNFEEVVPEIRTWLDEHPYFGRLSQYEPGMFDLAYKALYFDKSTELAKKAAYAEQLKETEKLKKAGSESPSPAGSSTPRAYTGTKDLVKSRMDAEGGVSF